VIAQILFQLTSAVASVGRVKTSSHKNWPSDEEAKPEFAPDSPVEGDGFEPSVPRVIDGDYRWDAPPKVRFATDSPVEGGVS
jgi:hypothetical protein